MIRPSLLRQKKFRTHFADSSFTNSPLTHMQLAIAKALRISA
jgi:hypothetical protein